MTHEPHKAVSTSQLPETLQETAVRVVCGALQDALAAHRRGIESPPQLWADLVAVFLENAAVGERPILMEEN